MRWVLGVLIMISSTAFLCSAEEWPLNYPLTGKEILPGLQWLEWGRGATPDISILKVDPECFRFGVYNFRAQGEPQPLGVQGWIAKIGAVAVFNAGQYYPDLSYMGFLLSQGRTIKGRLHPIFQAIFVAEPVTEGLPLAGILDLAMDEFDPYSPGYLEAAQSFMLLDRKGNIRVKHSPKMARRTIVAEQRDGKILIMVTRSPYTLWDLASLILEGPFAIRQAMSMDGGEEAQLAVKVKGFIYPQTPHWEIQQGVGDKPLPTVVGIFPREGVIDGCAKGKSIRGPSFENR